MMGRPYRARSTCGRCGRPIDWSDGAACWVVRSQALPPACGTTETGARETVRGHVVDSRSARTIRTERLRFHIRSVHSDDIPEPYERALSPQGVADAHHISHGHHPDDHAESARL